MCQPPMPCGLTALSFGEEMTRMRESGDGGLDIIPEPGKIPLHVTRFFRAGKWMTDRNSVARVYAWSRLPGYLRYVGR